MRKKIGKKLQNNWFSFNNFFITGSKSTTHSLSVTLDLSIRTTLDTISDIKYISRGRERHSCSCILSCEQLLSTSTVHYTRKKKIQM